MSKMKSRHEIVEKIQEQAKESLLALTKNTK